MSRFSKIRPICQFSMWAHMIAGGPSHGYMEHEYRAGCLLLQKCLASFPGLTVTVVSNNWPTDPSVFEGSNAAVLAVSCDTRHAQAQWAEQQGFAFPILSDFWPHGEVAKAYGVFNDQLGCANRGSFVIDKNGAVSKTGNSGSDLPDAGVVACIVQAFKGLSFPQPERGTEHRPEGVAVGVLVRHDHEPVVVAASVSTSLPAVGKSIPPVPARSPNDEATTVFPEVCVIEPATAFVCNRNAPVPRAMSSASEILPAPTTNVASSLEVVTPTPPEPIVRPVVSKKSIAPPTLAVSVPTLFVVEAAST